MTPAFVDDVACALLGVELMEETPLYCITFG